MSFFSVRWPRLDEKTTLRWLEIHGVKEIRKTMLPFYLVTFQINKEEGQMKFKKSLGQGTGNWWVIQDLLLLCSHDGQYVICGSEDHFVYIWRTQHGIPSSRRDKNEFYESFSGKATNRTRWKTTDSSNHDIRVPSSDEQVNWPFYC